MRYLLSLTTLLALLLAFSPLQAKERAPLYHSIEPAFVVNVQGGTRPQFMQVRIQVMSYDRMVLQRLDDNLPAVRHALILLLSSQSSDTMRQTAGREQVRLQASEIIQQTLREVAGVETGIEAVYFTDLVIQ